MTTAEPTILATSGGYVPGVRTSLEFGPLVRHAVDLAGAAGRPRVCLVGTAGGDQAAFRGETEEAARLAGFDLAHLRLFTMPNVLYTPHVAAWTYDGIQNVGWHGARNLWAMISGEGHADVVNPEARARAPKCLPVTDGRR